MKALTYIEGGRFEIIEKAEPRVVEATDALVRVILSIKIILEYKEF